MLRNIMILAILVIINGAMIYGTYLKMQKEVAVPEVMSASSVPDFAWKDFAGKTHNIKELSGHVIVIHFWATWCAPCRREFPELLKAAAVLGNDVTFLTISGDEKQGNAEKFIAQAQKDSGAKQSDNVIYAFDPDKTISFDVFQTAVYPESIVVDKAGNMRRKFVGAADWADEGTLHSLQSYAH